MRSFLVLALLALAVPTSARAFSLGLPVACDMEKICSIHKYMDHDPGPGRMDYSCGRLSKDGDTGADFRVPNLAIMHAGVSVLAAADGVIRATRDGMRDISVKKTGQAAVRGRFAGNGVVMTHPGGWETQYSHLKRGSIRVREGQRVKAGQVIGQIGLSGNTEFPHVEFSVRRNGKPVDPFVGELKRTDAFSCGNARQPLWNETAQAQLSYRATGVLSAGFAPEAANIEKARRGDYAFVQIGADSPALVFWADIFGAEAGDVQRMTLLAPNAEIISERRTVLKDNNIAWFAFSGKKRPKGGWQIGTYFARYTLERNGRIVAQTERTLEIKGPVNAP